MSRSHSRRRFLAGASTAAVTAVAGCSGILKSAVSSIFEDVNVINNTDQPVSGSITVTDPNNETVLDETFELTSSDRTDTPTPETGTETASGAVRYPDVFTMTGSYTVAVTLGEDSAIDGVREAEETVTVEDTDNTNVLVTLGGTEETDESIGIGAVDTSDDTDTETG